MIQTTTSTFITTSLSYFLTAPNSYVIFIIVINVILVCNCCSRRCCFLCYKRDRNIPIQLMIIGLLYTSFQITIERIFYINFQSNVYLLWVCFSILQQQICYNFRQGDKIIIKLSDCFNLQEKRSGLVLVYVKSSIARFGQY